MKLLNAVQCFSTACRGFAVPLEEFREFQESLRKVFRHSMAFQGIPGVSGVSGGFKGLKSASLIASS